MDSADFEIASLLAADLRGGSIDHNQVKKLLSYMRSERQGKALFEYLQLILSKPEVVRYSNQTPQQYRSIQEACARHLRPLQDDYLRLMRVLGWSIRLLRYYKEVPEAAPRRTAGVGSNAPASEPIALPTQATAPATRSSGSSLLESGEVFRGIIIEVLEGGVKIRHPDHSIEQVLGIIDAERVGKSQFKVKNTRWVKILGVNKTPKGLTVLELEPTENPVRKD